MIRIRTADQIGNAIAFMRDITGQTQRDLAAATGYAQSQIAAWETGQFRPNLGTLVHLLDTFGYELALVPKPDAGALTPDRRTA